MVTQYGINKASMDSLLKVKISCCQNWSTLCNLLTSQLLSETVHSYFCKSLYGCHEMSWVCVCLFDHFDHQKSAANWVSLRATVAPESLQLARQTCHCFFLYQSYIYIIIYICVYTIIYCIIHFTARGTPEISWNLLKHVGLADPKLPTPSRLCSSKERRPTLQKIWLICHMCWKRVWALWNFRGWMGNWVKGRNQCTRLKFHCFLQQESKTQESPRKTTVASLVAYSVAVLWACWWSAADAASTKFSWRQGWITRVSTLQKWQKLW
jgi:hypothetical protein